MSTAVLAQRIAVSPYARRLARERGIALEGLAGTGAGGRIVAADIGAYVPKASAAPVGGPQASALGTTITMTAIRGLLEAFGAGSMPFALEDIVLRAAGCALDDVPPATALAGAPVAVETKFAGGRGQVVFGDIRKGSLAPLRARRLAALEAGTDESLQPAAMSLRLVVAGDIRPVVMPLLPGRAMRLVLIAGAESGECLLSFDAAVIDEEVAGEVLNRFKAYLEVPLRLLA